mmetsp:Transcript_39696/g.95482  ORF Transcript_39696/g.95482 Transcript_39696/m.95482 type:complete len:673 (+) Transcript_39696:278-2296(+)
MYHKGGSAHRNKNKSRSSPQYIDTPDDRKEIIMSSSQQRRSKHRTSSSRSDRTDRGTTSPREERDRDAGGGGGGGTRRQSSSHGHGEGNSSSQKRERGDNSNSNSNNHNGVSSRGGGGGGGEHNAGGRRSLSPLHVANNNNNSETTTAQHGSRAMGASSPSEMTTGSRKITDDAVQLDLPMADLMAYLQVVANNSSNLPLTRRDDPELGRTVSSLTSEEYAFKCAAFVPSNVRILGGQFGKYGRVWDLPTSEEFDVTTSSREPGISHGGACCNALLKAMYDTESEVNNVASPHVVDAKNLFDDDDDETVDTAGYTVDRTLGSFDTLVLNDGNNSNSMSWAQLLRKMKPEMQGVGFNQVPAVTSSYKFDLNEPFSLVPPDFKKGVNQKRALLIGSNYRRTPDAELKACHDDVRSVKDFLVNVYGFPESPDMMRVLMDDKKHKHPTHTNITESFKQLAEKSHPGDAVFVLFTGHGCRVLDSPIDETAESYDEALIPSDYEETGIIRDTLFFKTLLAPMRKGVTVTCIIDCCHTGAMIDLPYLWTTKGDKGEPLPKMSLNNDFSFVRFLKVVKTLYESSVFTRIGKTVGSELDKQLPARDDETVIETVGSLETMPENEQPEKKKSLFERLCSPATLAQHIINCTLQAPDEYSDDEATLGRNNTLEDEQSHYSYDS